VHATGVMDTNGCVVQGLFPKKNNSGNSKLERRRRESIEAPKAPRRVGCGEGVSPSPLGEGSGRGAVPPPQKNFSILDLK